MSPRNTIRVHALITEDQQSTIKEIAKATAQTASAILRQALDRGIPQILESAHTNSLQRLEQNRMALEIQKQRMAGESASTEYLDNLADMV